MTEMPAVPRERFTDLRMMHLALRLGSFRSEILGWGFFEPRWWRNYLHEHSFFEICYAYQGRGLFRINNRDYTVGAGEVFVARPGEPHEIISSEDDPLGIYFWSYTLVPPQQFAPGTDETDVLLHSFLDASLWVSDRAPAMQATLDLLTQEIALRQPGYTQAVEGLVSKLLLDTARAVTDLPPAELTSAGAYNPAEAVVQQIVRYLHDNYSRPLAVRDVAAQVHLSERHTNRLFRQIIGVPINDYLTNFRLKVAKQLLLNRQLSITEIAYASGYRDVRYFVTLFRRRTGLTPSAFRQRGGTQFL